MKTILFVCIGNSCRSQIAEAITRKYYSQYFEVHSGGIKPEPVRNATKKILQENGININNIQSKSLERFKGRIFDIVYTLCDTIKENNTLLPEAKEYRHHHIADPADCAQEIEKLVYGNTYNNIENLLKDTLHIV